MLATRLAKATKVVLPLGHEASNDSSDQFRESHESIEFRDVR
jgi:hypothetical protein